MSLLLCGVSDCACQAQGLRTDASDGEHTDMVTLVPVTSHDVTSASPTSDHVTNTTTTSSDVTCTSSSVETTSDHVTSVETTSDHVTSKDTTSDHVTSVARTSDHVTSKATTSDHVTTVATASTHVTSVATASTHVTTSATTSTHVTSKSTASSHVTAVATTSGHVTPAAAVVQSSVVTSPAAVAAPGGTHQLYQVVPVVQNGVPCRLLVPLNMLPPGAKVVTKTRPQPTGKDGKPPGTVGSPGTAVAMSSASGPTGAVQKVIAVPPTVAAGSRPGQ
ncbi:PREDICTED: cell wall protein DAN4-like [Branchiostoma belcheri]|uniref:Cell wall protein DAN4-like n=1 Tax=Branchiostoma belcheri TaxID=7741 RepID=A0A6P4YC68_BRABE|nr:PREDICTED: cell wall protein DAN4-like [Branchiostoma belcheri]